MASLAEELQLVFQSACSALQASCSREALDNYYLARSRIRFVLQGVLGPAPQDDPALAVVMSACRQCESTFSCAIEQLNQEAASCGTAMTAEAADGSSTQQPQMHPPEGMDVGAGLLEAARAQAAAQGAGTMQVVRSDPGGSGSADASTLQQQQQQGVLQEVVQRCLRPVSGSLDDVMGLAAIKQELREAVLLPMHLPQLFTGIRRPQSNVLLYGRPGTGKTLLVEKAAAEAGIPLLAISPSSVLSKWSGESEKSLRAVFDAAAAHAPAIIFIDEIDALAPTRSAGDDLSARRVLTELLLCLTAVSSRPSCLVFVMACTNRLEDSDPALLRRFERKIEVPAPDADARAAFFQSTMQRPEIASQLSPAEVQHLVEMSEGMTGSDLAVACRDAAMAPLRELLADLQAGSLAVQDLAGATTRLVAFRDFVAAVQRTREGSNLQ